jgi:hypothetical protein
MNVLIVEIVSIVLFTGSSDVTVIIIISFLYPVDGCPEPVGANVKLSSLDKQWPFNVFLNDESRVVPQRRGVAASNDSLNFC